jgi:DNA uptake protein ComE-like DNA-binding protein
MNRTLNRIFLLTFTLFCTALSLYAQKSDTSLLMNSRTENSKMEDIVERTDAELDYSDFADDLGRLGRHPVNLNAASDQDLRKLTFLNELQLANLRSYLQQYGSIASIYELQMIEGFNQEIIELMAPYISLSAQSQNDKITFSRLLRHGKADLMLRYQQVLEHQKGYQAAPDSILLASPNARYLGGQGRLYARFKYTYSERLQCGLTAEKDPGETFFSPNDTLKKGFDFYSAHIYYQGPGFLKQVALGDYHVQFGQGLTLWSGLSFGKLPGDVGGKKSGLALRPSSSANENLFMRGAAATIRSGKVDLTLFYSSHHVDANLVEGDSPETEDAYFSSLQESGYHRTPNELADKHAVLLEASGAHVTFKTGTIRLGATAYQAKLDARLHKSSAPAYKFENTNQKSINSGMDYDYLYKKLNLYGEVARSDNGAIASINGLAFAADPRFLFSAIYRNYPRNYNNLLCNAFAESSHPSNEKALYTGFVASLSSKWTLTASVDQYRFEWLKYRVDAPSHGEEYATQVTWLASRTSQLTLRYSETHKQLNSTESPFLNVLQSSGKRDVRVQFSITPTPYLSLKSRVAYSEYMDIKGTSNGYLVYQDVGFRPEKSNFSLLARMALFDAPVYDSRLYAYENDVLYAFTSSSYYGIGSRFYIIAAWQPARHIELWLKYSRTYYSDRQMISSGLDEIEGNKRTEVKVQLRLAL